MKAGLVSQYIIRLRQLHILVRLRDIHTAHSLNSKGRHWLYNAA